MSAREAAEKSPQARAEKQSRGLLLLGLIGAIALIALGALLAGRKDEQLLSDYGRKRGAEGLPSVNGTAVLGELFKKAGHRVSIRTRLSPRLDDFDVVVWVPDNFEPPTKEQREFLEEWLKRGTEKRPRTIVYVGRDYDTAVAY